MKTQVLSIILGVFLLCACLVPVLSSPQSAQALNATLFLSAWKEVSLNPESEEVIFSVFSSVTTQDESLIQKELSCQQGMRRIHSSNTGLSQLKNNQFLDTSSFAWTNSFSAHPVECNLFVRNINSHESFSVSSSFNEEANDFPDIHSLTLTHNPNKPFILEFSSSNPLDEGGISWFEVNIVVETVVEDITIEYFETIQKNFSQAQTHINKLIELQTIPHSINEAEVSIEVIISSQNNLTTSTFQIIHILDKSLKQVKSKQKVMS